MKKAPTLKDVALLAGVSPYTVSAVINGARSNTQVSEATRRRIVESAATVNYHPNAVARSLSSRRTFYIGVQFGVLDPVEAIGNTYASAVLHGIMREAAAHRYNVVLFTQAWVNAKQSAPAFRDRRTDGVILVAPLSDTDMLSALSELPLALVAISPPATADGNPVPSVDVDNAHGIYLAVRHLADLGHTRIAHITGNANVGSVRERAEAFHDSLMRCGLPVAPAGYVVEATYDATTVSDLLPGLLALSEPPTAIVAGNDNIALAVIAACRALGVRVPEELSVVGFDDIPTAKAVTPALTTVRQPLSLIGAEATRLLIAQIEESWEPSDDDPQTEISFRLTPELIVRASTAPASAR